MTLTLTWPAAPATIEWQFGAEFMLNLVVDGQIVYAPIVFTRASAATYFA